MMMQHNNSSPPTTNTNFADDLHSDVVHSPTNTLSDSGGNPFSSVLTSPTNSISFPSTSSNPQYHDHHSNTVSSITTTTYSHDHHLHCSGDVANNNINNIISTTTNHYQHHNRYPRTSIIAQRVLESEKLVVLSPNATVLVQDHPGGGPRVEKFVEMMYTPAGSDQFLRFAGNRAIENMKGTLQFYNYPSDMSAIVEDVEVNMLIPLNRILDRQQKISVHYEMYFKILLHSLIFIAFLTLGFGIVLFPCLALVHYLHWKHVRNYDTNVKDRIRRILERENKKYLPHGFEWIVKYATVDSAKRTQVGVRQELTSIHEVTLSLVHLNLPQPLPDSAPQNAVSSPSTTKEENLTTETSTVLPRQMDEMVEINLQI